MAYELLFLKSLILTIFIETIVMILFVRFVVRLKDISISSVITTGVIASFATLPYLWFVFPNYIEQQIWYVIIGETFAVFVETIIIGAILRTKFLNSLLCSFTCNLISFLTGLIINWP